jgi:D-glycero-D-manno-heptose 1,7-bisphosphate phosphatase
MKGALRRAVFLDRDGVLNRAIVKDGRPYSPQSPAEVEIPDDAPAALQALRAAGLLLVCVTNQPDVARGLQRREVVETINAAVHTALPLDDLLVCYHDDADACDCRKPQPGLLLEAAGRHGIDLDASFMIGDRWKDVEAGRRAGCTTLLIDHGYSEPLPPGRPPDWTARSLAEAAAWILNHRGDTAIRCPPQ